MTDTIYRAFGQDAHPWMQDARCRDTAVDMFPGTTQAEAKPAKRVCAECPVRVTCLRHALDHREAHGVWGGLDERERRALGRKA